MFVLRFRKASFSRLLKVGLCGKGLYICPYLDALQLFSGQELKYHVDKQRVEALTLSKTINIRLFQTERVCRRQFQIR